jgi:hypothetical protein
MTSLSTRLRLALNCAGMLAIAAALACTCTLPLSLQATPTETLPPVLVATQPAPTAVTLVPAASVTISPTLLAPIVVTLTKTRVTTTITPTTGPPPPGGGSSGIAQSDLEIYGLSPILPVGNTTTLTFDVRNNGPSQGFLRADLSQACAPAAADVSVHILQSVGTGHFNVDLITNPACVYPGGQCSIIVPDNKDPNPANNQYGFTLP